jgi:hypothetical protein
MKNYLFPTMAAIGIGLLMAGSALAQNVQIAGQIAVPQSPDEPDVFFEAVGPGPGGPPDAIGFVAFEGGVNGKTVAGAPFTASFSTNAPRYDFTRHRTVGRRWQCSAANDLHQRPRSGHAVHAGHQSKSCS